MQTETLCHWLRDITLSSNDVQNNYFLKEVFEKPIGTVTFSSEM